MTTIPASPQPSFPKTWFVYIVECADSTYYTGVTTDLQRRLHEHNHSPKGAKYTRCRRPVSLVYYEVTDTRQNACRREYKIKQMKVSHKKDLVTFSTQKTT